MTEGRRQRYLKIRAFTGGVIAASLFYAVEIFVPSHILHLKYPRLFTAAFIVLFFLLGVLFLKLLKRKKPRSKRLLKALIFASLAVIAISAAAITKIGPVKEYIEQFLYGWKYFLTLSEYARPFWSDIFLLVMLLALPSFLLAGLLFPGIRQAGERPSRGREGLPALLFVSGILITGVLIVKFLPLHRYEVVEELPKIYLKKDGRVIMKNRLSDIAAERLKVCLPLIIGGEKKTALFIGFGSGEALNTAREIPSIESIICLEPDSYFESAARGFSNITTDTPESENRVKIVRKDAKGYLSAREKMFDLIVINDEKLPWKKNIEVVKDHLAENGILIAAVSIDSSGPRELEEKLSAYQDLFGETTVWMAHPSLPARLLVMGRNKKLNLEMPLLRKSFKDLNKNADVLRALKGVNINNIFDLLDTLIFSREQLMRYLRSGEKEWTGMENAPFLNKLSAPSRRETDMIWRSNLIDIVRMRSAPVELFDNGIPARAEDILEGYYQATANTVLGQIYGEINGFFKHADYEFRKAVKLNPFDRDAFYALGVPMQFASLIANARARYTPATEDIIKGRTLLLEDNRKAALEMFKEAVRKDPEDELARLYLADILQETGEPAEALWEYKSIIMSNPGFTLPPLNEESLQTIAIYQTLVMTSMGMYYWKQNMMNEFAQSIKDIIEFGCEPSFLFPEEISGSPKFRKCLGYVKSRLPLPSKDSKAGEVLAGYYSSLGYIYWLMGNYKAAVRYSEEALDLAERSEHKESLYINLGIYFAEMGKFKKAEEYYSTALEINPNITHVNNYIKINNIEIELEEDPDNVSLLVKLAGAYEELGDFEKVMRYLKKALELNRESTEIEFMYEEVAIQRRLSLDPDDFYSLNSLGVLYWKNEEPEKAIQLFKTALEINPYFADTYFNLAIAYKALGMKEEAIIYLKRVLKLNPEMVKAREELKKIEKG